MAETPRDLARRLSREPDRWPAVFIAFREALAALPPNTPRAAVLQALDPD